MPASEDLPSRALMRAFGVTRIGRLTGLDRSGVEVACAVRPRGHVLQASNGKGRTFRDAAHAALSEAAELAASETVDPVDLRWASAIQMRGRFGKEAVWGVGPWMRERTDADLESITLAWVEGRGLFTGAQVWVPAAAVFCPPPGQMGLAPLPVRWTSNGLAAHPRREAAVAHALRELAERDTLARALPQGWTARAVRAFHLPRAQWAGVSASAAASAEVMRARGLIPFLFSWPRGAPGGVPLPVAAALLFDEEGSAIPLTAGYACHTTLGDALEGALWEAAQSRLTDIHGAREDVTPMNAADVKRLRGWCQRAARGSSEEAASLPRARKGRRGLPTVTAAFERGGHRQVVLIDLASARTCGLSVVRALAPGLQLTELL
ncbi:MAG TPA: YcaO-like family protein [Myxococcaceae bacterium]|nr:YcaO-like family protein [Myxococcaceae bacterium]